MIDISIKNSCDSSTTVAIKGSLDSTSADDAKNSIIKLVPDFSKEIVFDMSGVNYLSSAGLRTMVTLKKMSAAVGGKIRLTNLQEMVASVFEITGLNSLFDL